MRTMTVMSLPTLKPFSMILFRREEMLVGSIPWKVMQHANETVPSGPDDMPAHIKSSMFGCSVTIPITDGHLNLGTWQGIWLCEHRDHGTPRKIVITMQGA